MTKLLKSYLLFLAIEPKSYKSDPILSCNISLENESFLERFKCIVMYPLHMYYTYYPFISQLNNLRKKFNPEPRGNLPKVSLSLIDNFFGFEVIIIIN